MTAGTTPKVYFFHEDVQVSLRNRTALKGFIESIFRKENRKLETLNYVFCTDERLLEINRQYLNHDYYTDIITFDLAEKGLPTIGDVYISYERVKENAQNAQINISEELLRVIFHGALHLCGYKDKTKAETKLMREKEEQYLTLYSKSIRST